VTVWNRDLAGPRVGQISDSRDRFSNLLLAAILLVGIYCPTSMSGQQSPWLWGVPGFVAILGFSILIVVHGIWSGPFLCSIILMASLLGYTVITSLWTVTPGAFLPYALVALLLCTNFSRINYGWPLRVSWIAVNVVNIGLSLLIIADVRPAKHFVIAYYSAFYDTLATSMLNADKPVLMFGSHSIAAFFFFVCFYLHLRMYTATRSFWSFVVALVYLGLLISLKSVSGYFLAIGGIALLIYHTFDRRAILLAVGCAFVAVIGASLMTKAQWEDATSTVERVIAAPESGFQGRYSSSGVLAVTLRYIGEHPLQGIGINYSDRLWYGDSGPTELMIRGSLPLLLAFYGGFWLFLRMNLCSSRTAAAVFLIYFAFEIAFSNLLYLRTACVLPLVIVYLNASTRQTV
jgi:hypothetical protein